MAGRLGRSRMGRSSLGRAVDSATGERYPAKLVTAVPTGSDEIPDEAIKQRRPQWRVQQNRANFALILQPVMEFVHTGGVRSGGNLRNFLVKLPGLSFSEAARNAFGAAIAPIREFLDSFAETFV